MPPPGTDTDQQYTNVSAPDGSTIRFPSTMKAEEIQGAMQKLFPPPMSRGATMSAQPSFMEKLESLAVPGKRREERFANQAPPEYENYTPEGRREHPILARIGDITRGAKQFGGMITALSPLIVGPEAEGLPASMKEPEAFGLGKRAAQLAKPAVEQTMKPAAPIPTVEATPVRPKPVRPLPSMEIRRPGISEPLPTSPPPVETAHRLEPIGTVENPERLGTRGTAGVRVPERKLLPAAPESRITLAKPEPEKLPAATNEADKMFNEGPFGPFYAEARDLSAWETGSPEGVTPQAPRPGAAGWMSPKPEPQSTGQSNTIPVESPGTSRPLRPVAAKPTIDSVVNQAVGVKPLQRNVPLKAQLRPITPAEPAPEPVDPIKERYPDPEIRRYVRANGPELVDAVGDDKALLYKLHNLKNVEVREAAVNSGIELGTKHAGSKQLLGPEQVSRQEIFKQLLAKGIKPEEILELAKPKPKGE